MSVERSDRERGREGEIELEEAQARVKQAIDVDSLPFDLMRYERKLISGQKLFRPWTLVAPLQST
jgi:hypothetical protein